MISNNIKNEIMVLSHLQNLCQEFDTYYIYKFSNSDKHLKKKLKNESVKKYIKKKIKKIQELKNKFLSNKLTAHFSAPLVVNKEKIFVLDYDEIKIYDNKYIIKLADIGSREIIYSDKVREFYYTDFSDDSEKEEEDNCFEKTIYIKFDINTGQENVINNCLQVYNIINYIQKTYKSNSIDSDITNKSENSKIYDIPHCTYCSYLSLLSVIGLDNKDDFLILLLWEGVYQEYAVCRLKAKNVSIIQSITSDFDNYQIISVSPLSEKRFIVYLKNGIDIYCLNQKNNLYYSEIFIKKYDNPDIKKIYDANDIIIICTAIESIVNDNKNYKRLPTYKIRTSIQNLDSNKKILFLKFEIIIYSQEKIDKIGQKENTYNVSHNINFSKGIILKNKYFIFMADNNLLILSLLTFEIIKNYSLIFYYDDDFLIYQNFQIEKWDEINDNEFILNVNGNITLFDLKEDNLEIGLNILAYYYFPGMSYIQKMNDNNNYCKIFDKQIDFY